jgi:lipopolysaccharide export system protein LptA
MALVKHILLCLLPALVISGSVIAQEKQIVKVLHADNWFYDQDVMEAQRLIGNVALKYKDTIMHCDSAYVFENEDFDAFGHVRINQGDSLTVLGNSLQFDSETRMASLRNNITMKDREMTLKTDHLDYNLDANTASYFGGGEITSKKNQNTLTSNQGLYFSDADIFQFRNNVVLINPDYTINSDTLKYNNTLGKSWFLGPTTIVSKDSEIYCENGFYDSITDIYQFDENARILSGSTILSGDSIYYQGKDGLGEVFGNVFIEDTTSNYLITGEYGWHNDSTEQSFVTDRALMIQKFDTDSLFLHADTLFSLPDSSGNKVIHAYHGVKFFKPDLQGASDSLTYSENDSLLVMFIEPVLWSKSNQISGDTIKIKLFKGTIDKLMIDRKAFIISESAPDRYNQIKGKRMTGYFKDNALDRIHVRGNGQAVYFPLEDGSDPPKAIGVNKAECSDLMITVDESDITRITLLNKPSGILHPLSKASEEDMFLKGFVWLVDKRPESYLSILE